MSISWGQKSVYLVGFKWHDTRDYILKWSDEQHGVCYEHIKTVLDGQVRLIKE